MKFNYILILTFLIAACGSRQVDKTGTPQVDTVNQSAPGLPDEDNDDASFNETDTFYVVVADTGNDYYQLRDQMLSVAKTTDLLIDTLGRYYDKSKDLIMLPDNDEDEIYRGNYYPRRFPSDNLSLEYLDVYSPVSGDKTIAFVTGIYETKHAADSAKRSMLNIQPKTFVLKSEIYTGCMH
jgi:hypothetical protein